MLNQPCFLPVPLTFSLQSAKLEVLCKSLPYPDLKVDIRDAGPAHKPQPDTLWPSILETRLIFQNVLLLGIW